jgi:hypothetical protein
VEICPLQKVCRFEKENALPPFLLLFPITVVPWPFQHISIGQLINFEIFISTNGISQNIHNYPSQYFLIWKKKNSTFQHFSK